MLLMYNKGEPIYIVAYGTGVKIYGGGERCFIGARAIIKPGGGGKLYPSSKDSPN